MIRTVAGPLLREGRVGLLPGTYNPPTLAHIALAETAQRRFALDQIVQVLPEALPHKRIERPSVEERLEWLAQIAHRRAGWAACACAAGLVIDIVDAFRRELGVDCELFVIAGCDAAERYANWDYADREPFSEQIRRYRLLVGGRGGAFLPPGEHAGRILPFEIDPRHARTSSTAVRGALERGEPWRHRVPPEICNAVAEAYGGTHA